MKPIFAKGNSIAETWENALVSLWREGIDMETQYDIDPHTNYKHPPSKDCMMIMEVENALDEPRLHVCLEGGPAELAEYKLEVVDGIKDHWVKLSPDSTEWTYTYHNRLFSWGNQLNFATSVNDGPVDENNPWVQLAYVKKMGKEKPSEELIQSGYGSFAYEIIPPVDQIQHIIDTLVDAPFSRRGVALTGFPAGDKDTHDPPCLRYVWCRGNYEKNYLSIDMHTHWRSRDAYGAALFNMYALTELQRYIVDGIINKFGELYKNNELSTNCPRCGTLMGQYCVAINNPGMAAGLFSCDNCGLSPYRIKAGRYVDVSDSFHVYGHKLKEFEERFINSALQQPRERRFWNLSSPEMIDLIKEGESKAYKTVQSLDEKKGKIGFPSKNKSV